MLEAAIQGLENLFHLNVFLAIVAGVGVGTFTAVAPQGVGTPLMYALFLPVVIQWDPIVAIGFLIGMDAVSSICSSYLPILFGIPGGAGSQATVLDGYPMGRQGEARRALGASFMAGMLGSVIGTLTLAVAIPLARPMVMLLGSPELFIITLWGVSMVSVLTGPRPIKGLIAGAFGLLLSIVGIQPQSGVDRFVFDQPYLFDGLPISVMALAVFGIPSALDMALTRVGVEQAAPPLKGSLLHGVKDTLHNIWLVVRCSFLGVWVGIIPGLGAQVVDWLSYGHAAQTCKGARDSFGKGDVRGVIAPESANDAKDGGTLIITLTLGVPGSLVSALFLFALITMGFSPGPDLLRQHADLLYSIVWVLGLAGVGGALLGFLLANHLAKLAQLRYSLIVPMILAFVLVGALSATRHAADLVIVVMFGAIGYFMKRFGYPRPPFLLGMILGILMEKYLYISTARYGLDWLGRPLVLVLLLLVIASVALSIWGRREKTQSSASVVEGGKPAPGLRLGPEGILTLFFLAVFAGVIGAGWSWPFIAKLMPLYVAAIPGAALALAQLRRDLAGMDRLMGAGQAGVEMDEGFVRGLPQSLEIHRTAIFFCWFAGAALAVWLFGIVATLPLFVFLYTSVEGREKLWISVSMAAGAAAFVWGLFEGLFEIIWPPGQLFM